jgi:hypothetical protein
MMEQPLKVGSWSVRTIPPGWEVVPGYGLRSASENTFPSTVVLTEEKLPEGMTLPGYVANSIEIMRRLLPEPKIKGPDPFSFPEAEEAQQLAVAYKSKDDRSVVQRQIYAGAAGVVGIVTFTTVEEEMSNVSGAFRAIGSGLRFGPGHAPSQP